MTLDLDELVKEEQTSDSLAPVRDDLHEAARDYLRHLRREHDEYDKPHTKEAQRANDEYEGDEELRRISVDGDGIGQTVEVAR